MARREIDAIPLSRFGVLVAQLESIVASAPQQPPDALLCFDLLSELIAAIEDEPKGLSYSWSVNSKMAILDLQLDFELYSFQIQATVLVDKDLRYVADLKLQLAFSHMIFLLLLQESIQQWQRKCAAKCLGELYHLFGRRITSGLVETTSIAAKLMKFHEDFVRQDAMQMLENALEGSGGSGASTAYSEAFRIIMRVGVNDKALIVRLAAARCLKTFASIGGPGLGITELENSIIHCFKALEDPIQSVRDAFAEALGVLLALAMNPEAQIKQRGKNHSVPAKKLDDGLQKHLISPFIRASGVRAKEQRIGLALSWVFFLQVICVKYHLPDSELQKFALLSMDMLQGDASLDAQALWYDLRCPCPAMRVAALRILSYLLTTLGEVPVEFKDVLDNTVVAALSHSSLHVRIEAALTLRALAEVDPTCVGGLISYGVTTLHALRESARFEKGMHLNPELDSLHGQAAIVAALVSISPKLLLGYPASVLSAATEALTAFIRSFESPTVASTNAVLLQPVLAYLRVISNLLLSSALSYISSFSAKLSPNIKPALDLFTIRTLMAYRSVSDPAAYKSEHPQIIRICTSPFRDWFEDELRAFNGGKDGLMPCIWDEVCSFPQPEPISKMLVNQMLLCFGTIFASQDNGGKLMLLNKIDHCLKNGKKQSWRVASITNACVGLLAGLKTRSLLGELVAAADPNYIGSIALSLGCIHRRLELSKELANNDASLTQESSCVIIEHLFNKFVWSSDNYLSAKSPNASLQLWALHALLLTIEAAGLSYVSQVQATLFLAMDILLSEENGLVELRQEIGRLINAIVAVLGPELAPGSTFFSRCKSVIAEISSCQEISTLLESVRFTQQLVLFAPQAVSVHSHVQSLLPTLSSRQPSLRSLAVSTLHHLIEKDPVYVRLGLVMIHTKSAFLFKCCLILSLMVLATSTRSNAAENNFNSVNENSNGTSERDANLYYGDDEDMIAGSKGEQIQGSVSASSVDTKREKHLRYRTRVFAAESVSELTWYHTIPTHVSLSRFYDDIIYIKFRCLSCLPTAVGNDPAHFDVSLARSQPAKGRSSLGDWLVLHLQELVSLSYQISTGQFEGMQPIGVRLLSIIMDKFGGTSDPELPGHLLLEQYQAQLVSAVRSAISTSSSPLLLEAGLQLATKILTSSIVSGDRVALNRMFSLISRPLNDIRDLYYPSFAEWVACKYKPFLDGIQSLLVSSKVQECLHEAWPLILQATALDAIPMKVELDCDKDLPRTPFISGHSMGQQPLSGNQGKMLLVHDEKKHSGDSMPQGAHYLSSFEIALLVFQSLSKEVFFSQEFLSLDLCKELLQVLISADYTSASCNGLVIYLLSQVKCS
ncbi:putative HEAT repeat-containing protein [Cocos nucifera]|uniref:Putative HEAT repeat-containing protein n=1 Tax=Cocos nucifera TaxID=13894 RepID=A0A8K0HVU6_COCNU|nr:putative HEAT repeat-containing protein [Cocos nucifera]